MSLLATASMLLHCPSLGGVSITMRSYQESLDGYKSDLLAIFTPPPTPIVLVIMHLLKASHRAASMSVCVAIY